MECCYYLLENGAVETGIGKFAAAFNGYTAGINEEAMKLAETYVGFTFDEKYWKFDPEIHYEYPVLDRQSVEHGGHVFNQKKQTEMLWLKKAPARSLQSITTPASAKRWDMKRLR